jgi:tetratricopeptide (TPR) repeat protein
MQRYEQVLAEATQREHSLSSDTQNELKRLQQVLKLRDEDIDQIGAKAPIPAKVGLQKVPSISVSFLKNPKLLIGSGIVNYARGAAKAWLDDYKGAIADYNQAIQLKPKYPDAYYYRGAAKAWLEDYKGAIADYNQAIQLKPEYPDAYVGRGAAKARLDDYKGAIADYRKAAELYQKQGETKDYQDALKRIKELQ